MSSKKEQTREEEAADALGNTSFAPGAARFAVLVFLGIILAIPALQVVADRRSGIEPRVLHVFDIFRRGGGTTAAGQPSKNALNEKLRRFETQINDRTILADTLLPPTQRFLSSALRAGNSQVIVGADHWLFFVPDVNYVTLDIPKTNVDKLAVAAIALNNGLKSHGVQLVMMPIPPKPVFYSDKLGPSSAGPVLMENPAWDALKQKLLQGGLLVYDVTPDLVAARRESMDTIAPVFMPRDTHWSPRGMSIAAQGLSQFLVANELLPPSSAATLPAKYSRRKETINARQDCALLLGLTPSPETNYDVALDRVYDATQNPARCDPGADILIVGDSLSDIYDTPKNNYAASFAQQLAFDLQRPIDRITDPEKSLTPLAYAGTYLPLHPERLFGKKVIVWEFNVRILQSDQSDAMDNAAHVLAALHGVPVSPATAK